MDRRVPSPRDQQLDNLSHSINTFESRINGLQEMVVKAQNGAENLRRDLQSTEVRCSRTRDEALDALREVKEFLAGVAYTSVQSVDVHNIIPIGYKLVNVKDEFPAPTVILSFERPETGPAWFRIPKEAMGYFRVGDTFDLALRRAIPDGITPYPEDEGDEYGEPPF